ncbi:MAG TPA: VOC family protein [archaeon]|nr:VOC family protein [archaeon]
MAKISQKITPNLWFDKEAREATKFYTSIFKKSKILKTSYYGKAGFEIHHMKEGTIMTIEFELEGQKFMALNAGSIFKFNEAISFVVNCETQKEIDYFWEKLSAGGDPNSQMCGWLKDKFGLSWQIVPAVLGEMMNDKKKSEKVMTALLQMKKLDIEKLKQAHKS